MRHCWLILIANAFINVNNALINTALQFLAACFTGVLGHKFISKLFPFSDMTSTVKFKKFGSDLRIRKATEKSQLK